MSENDETPGPGGPSGEGTADGEGGETLADVLSGGDDGSTPGVASASATAEASVEETDAGEVGPRVDTEADDATSTARAVRLLEQGREQQSPERESPLDQSAVREAVLADLREYLDEHGDELAVDTPERTFLEENFFDFSYLDAYQEVERRWVNKPFAYVSVLYDPREREYRYHVSQPALDEFERYVRADLVEYLRNSLMYRDLGGGREKGEVFEEDVVELVREHARSVDDGTMLKLLYYLRRDFIQFGPIDAIMRDPAIEDVSCDGANVPVFVYHRAYRDLETNVEFSAERLSSFTVRLAQRAGKTISVSDPLLDATLPDGSRLQLTLGGEIATRGANFTIRKFSDVPFSPIDLTNWGTFSIEEMAYFWLAIENNKSLIFAGGTGSGKTSSLNAISFFIPPSAKVISIEDTREVDLPHKNWIQSVTRSSASEGGRGEVSMYRLLQAALRQRPEYLLVGEIRTEERVALTFFQAMGTGHTAYTTMHADSIDTVVNRLQNPPLNVPTAMIQDLDVIAIQKQTFVGEDRVRRNQQVTEVLSPEDDPLSIRTRDVFRWDASSDTHRRVGESGVLGEVADERGWSRERLAAEVERREGLLQFLVEESVTDYRDVAALVKLYHKDPEYVLERVRDRGYDLP
ncbi:type II/IV secretion system ATPase subunit [Salinirubellus salinus]|uniref:Type II/IV secretion system ATPase subunit n=1 Tax=Salinirubellus salinus TaxID=1364945 RepID=A0A9E7UD00_9EURY|nr:type II/IV secretion system ATPase subunit [Salinirubellus salinus]UWM56464.1 type II/IV secretion system ATPase subunit [Salinirubellus salinus]